MNCDDEFFYLGVIASGITCLTLIVRYVFKSKCDRFECGCIRIHRNVNVELPDNENNV